MFSLHSKCEKSDLIYILSSLFTCENSKKKKSRKHTIPLIIVQQINSP